MCDAHSCQKAQDNNYEASLCSTRKFSHLKRKLSTNPFRDVKTFFPSINSEAFTVNFLQGRGIK